MTITVLLFAGASERAGTGQIDVSISPPVTVSELQSAVLDRCPALSVFGGSLLWAVNNRYATGDQIIHAADSVACFPPVSGG